MKVIFCNKLFNYAAAEFLFCIATLLLWVFILSECNSLNIYVFQISNDLY